MGVTEIVFQVEIFGTQAKINNYNSFSDICVKQQILY